MGGLKAIFQKRFEAAHYLKWFRHYEDISVVPVTYIGVLYH
jgi:hypothetical protein